MDREREFVRFLSEFLAFHTEVSSVYLDSLITAFMKGARGTRNFPPPIDVLTARINADMGAHAVPTFLQNYLLKSSKKNEWPPQAAFVAAQLLRRPANERFMTWARRQQATSELMYDTIPGSELGFRQVLYSQGATQAFTWRGVPCFKPHYDIAIYAMLCFELRPATIIELGSGTGGSALFFSDLCKSLGVTTKVLSVDKAAVEITDPAITFIQADCIEWLAKIALSKHEIARPCMLIEDFHGDLAQCFDHFDTILDDGDYLVIEDSLDKQERIAGVIANHPYLVDSKYTDFFGTNCTTAMNSIFKKNTSK